MARRPEKKKKSHEPRKKTWNDFPWNPGCLIGILMSWLFIIPIYLGRISSPVYPKQQGFFSLLTWRKGWRFWSGRKSFRTHWGLGDSSHIFCLNNLLSLNLPSLKLTKKTFLKMDEHGRQSGFLLGFAIFSGGPNSLLVSERVSCEVPKNTPKMTTSKAWVGKFEAYCIADITGSWYILVVIRLEMWMQIPIWLLYFSYLTTTECRQTRLLSISSLTAGWDHDSLVNL